VLLARELHRSGVRRTHAVWATMPAAAAWMIWKISGIPYSMGAHAYDIFEHGGDWLLPMKLRDAALVHCSTFAAREQVLAMGCDAGKVVVVRRGLERIPAQPKPLRAERRTLRLVSVGRLVEKKGFRAQLRLYAELARLGLDFDARIAGSGPLEAELRGMIASLGLAGRVTLCGWLDEAGVERELEWADAFLFTGRTAASGDRDGLPNAVAEAMARGVPVLAAPAGAVAEIVSDGVNGLLLPLGDAQAWLAALERIRDDDAFCEGLRSAAHGWVVENFDARRNAALLLAKIEARMPAR